MPVLRQRSILVLFGALLAGCGLVAGLDGFDDRAPGGDDGTGGGGASHVAGDGGLGGATGGGGAAGGTGANGGGGGSGGAGGEAGAGGSGLVCDSGWALIPAAPVSGELFTVYYSSPTAYTYVSLEVVPQPEVLSGTSDVTGMYTWSWEVEVELASPTIHELTFLHKVTESSPSIAVASCQVLISP